MSEALTKNAIILLKDLIKIKSFSGTRIAFTRIPDKQEFHE